MGKLDAFKVYLTIRFFSSLFFATIVTVNLVYQATVVGLNPLQLVLVGTVLEIVSFFFEIPTGIVADLYSRRLSVITGLFLIGLGFAVEGLFPTFLAVLIAQVIWGIGFTFVSGAREAWIADEVGEEKAGKAYIEGNQMSQAGSLIGIILSMILGNINIRIPIIAGGILYSSQSLFLILFMPENNFKKTSQGERNTFQHMGHTFLEGLKVVRQNAVLITIVCAGFIFGMFSEGFDRLWTTFMIKTFTFPLFGSLSTVTWFGIINIVATLFAIGVNEVTKKFTDSNNHVSVTKSLFIINSLLSIAVILFGFAGNFYYAMMLFWAIYMFREARGPLYDAWTNQHLNPKIRATVFSMTSQANSAGQIFGGPILGLLATVSSLRWGIVGGGFVLIPTLLLYLYSMKRHTIGKIEG
jgi:DHA3 family tetracycline resistance protein-like MFS transporter